MDVTFELSFTGMNMEFAIHLTADGHSVPEGLFINIMIEKCQLLHQHLKASKDCLALVSNVNLQTASIKLFDQNVMKAPLLDFSISNLYDLEEQLYQLWIEVHKIMKNYGVHDPLAELGHIAHYYNLDTYRDLLCGCLL